MSLIMKEIEYEKQKCIIVFIIPMLNNKGQKQMAEESYYLSHPINKIVGKSLLFPKKTGKYN